MERQRREGGGEKRRHQGKGMGEDEGGKRIKKQNERGRRRDEY